ncbi:VWA domain-containing protein [Nocardioides pantholopis]|uniref:VWA domain-containing protein n=1 Tax=Nocardioides pantholopis TaxID=2483798 RepID=UPI000FDAB298|nr:VWA domain-containing protein [Nocardioides pantholopis]
MTGGLLERHLAFLEALRGAGLPVSLVEDLDAVAALGALPWDDREVVRTAYAATLVKRQAQRTTFDTLFDLYFPRLVGDGVAGAEAGPDADGSADGDGGDGGDAEPPPLRDGAVALRDLRDRLVGALAADDPATLGPLAVETVSRFGSMPGRGPGLSSWSAYSALRRVAPAELTRRIVAALLAEGSGEAEARRAADRSVGAFTALVEDDARRRIAEEKGPDHVARTAVRPSIERIDFTAARRADVEEMRRQIYPLARRLATRLTREQHARRRGPVDFRRTVRASVSTGGVPLTTHHRPKRPHRTDLVVLCDVSGSVANFAQFTLLLVLALREQFQNLRAFTFVDQVHEVTGHLRPGADLGDVMAELAASAEHAARWGRTSYGRAFTTFTEQYGGVLGPRSSLLILGDARSNYSDPGLEALREMAGAARHAWWLNPEHRRHWQTGDSLAGVYGEVVPMVECRNLTQLGEFVHDLV